MKDGATNGASASAAKQRLQWQSGIISAPLLAPPASSNKEAAAAYSAAAIKLHKKILVLSGDRSSRQSLLGNFRALELLVRPEADPGASAPPPPDLSEELFFQLIKQVEANPRGESEVLLWRLLCFASTAVLLDRAAPAPPSAPQPALVHVVGFLLARQEKAAAGAAHGDARAVAILPYTTYALRALELLQAPALARAPIFDDDLYAFLAHPPVLVDVLHPDGTVRRARSHFLIPAPPPHPPTLTRLPPLPSPTPPCACFPTRRSWCRRSLSAHP